ncbi:hypothetical protein V8B97DRAFT_1867014 [Scleroderma yunnanense]
MPRVMTDTDPFTNFTDGDLNTCVLHNCRITPLLNKFSPAKGVVSFKVGPLASGPHDSKAKKQAKHGPAVKVEDEEPGESPDGPTSHAICKVKPCCAVKPFGGWEKSMFSLRD